MNKGINLKNVICETDCVSEKWKHQSEGDRINKIQILLAKNSYDIEVKSAQTNGEVIVKTKSMSASIRGTILLAVESLLKQNIDIGINIWLEGSNDKNPLRNLRGIKVKI